MDDNAIVIVVGIYGNSFVTQVYFNIYVRWHLLQSPKYNTGEMMELYTSLLFKIYFL